MDTETREVWTSPASIVTSVVLLAVLALLVDMLTCVLAGSETLKLYGREPVSQAVPVLLILSFILGVIFVLRLLAWRVAVTDGDVRVYCLFRFQRSVPLSSLTGIREDKQAEGFDSLVLETATGDVRVTPAPPRTSSLVRRLERVLAEGTNRESQ